MAPMHLERIVAHCEATIPCSSVVGERDSSHYSESISKQRAVVHAQRFDCYDTVQLPQVFSPRRCLRVFPSGTLDRRPANFHPLRFFLGCWPPIGERAGIRLRGVGDSLFWEGKENARSEGDHAWRVAVRSTWLLLQGGEEAFSSGGDL
jgi:hypothetical protein